VNARRSHKKLGIKQGSGEKAKNEDCSSWGQKKEPRAAGGNRWKFHEKAFSEEKQLRMKLDRREPLAEPEKGPGEGRQRGYGSTLRSRRTNAKTAAVIFPKGHAMPLESERKVRQTKATQNSSRQGLKRRQKGEEMTCEKSCLRKDTEQQRRWVHVPAIPLQTAPRADNVAVEQKRNRKNR